MDEETSDAFSSLEARVRANSVMIMSLIITLDPPLLEHLLDGLQKDAKLAGKGGDNMYASALNEFVRQMRSISAPD